MTARTVLDLKREATGWLFAKGRGLWRESVGWQLARTCTGATVRGCHRLHSVSQGRSRDKTSAMVTIKWSWGGRVVSRWHRRTDPVGWCTLGKQYGLQAERHSAVVSGTTELAYRESFPVRCLAWKE